MIFECVGAPGFINQTMMEAPRGRRIVVAGVCQQPDTIMPVMGNPEELELPFALGYRHGISTTSSPCRLGPIHAAPMITDIIDLAGAARRLRSPLRKPTHQCKVMLEN